MSANNPVRSFDWQSVANLPEFHALAVAMDQLIHALPEPEHLTQGDLGDLARDVALSLPYGDMCQRCSALITVFPSAATVEDDRLLATYRCPRCTARWTCSWGVDGPWWVA